APRSFRPRPLGPLRPARPSKLSTALVVVALSSPTLACKPQSDAVAPTVQSTSGEAEYQAFVTDFFEGYFDHFPVSASMLGEHGGDGRWPALDASSEAEQLAWIRGMRVRSETLLGAQLDANATVDLGILRDQLALLELSL